MRPVDAEVDAGADAAITVAAFDFDGTLTRRDTLVPFLARGLGWPVFAINLLQCSPWLLAYALRLLPNHKAKARLLAATLGGRTQSEMADWTEQWFKKDFPGQLRSWTLERLQWHRARGHCCVLVSASPDIYLSTVSRELAFDGLICTEMEVQGEILTGRMRTPNCHGAQKVLRLNAWLLERFGAEAAAKATLYAYGDTSGDKPMLRMASFAWYRGRPWSGAR